MDPQQRLLLEHTVGEVLIRPCSGGGGGIGGEGGVVGGGGGEKADAGGELKAHEELTAKWKVEWRKIHDSCWEVASIGVGPN